MGNIRTKKLDICLMITTGLKCKDPPHPIKWAVIAILFIKN